MTFEHRRDHPFAVLMFWGIFAWMIATCVLAALAYWTASVIAFALLIADAVAWAWWLLRTDEPW